MSSNLIKVHRPLYEGVVAALISTFNHQYYADKVIERALKEHRQWGSRDRRFVAESVYEIVRWWRRLLWAVGSDVNQLEGPWPEETLRQVFDFWLDLKGFALPPWAKVSPKQLDEMKKRWEKTPSRGVAESIPDWLDQRGEKELGNRWPSLLAALNKPAPIYLRVNRLKTDVRSVQQALKAENIETVNLQADVLQLKERANVFVTAAFKKGWFEVQDLSSQHVAPFLGVQSGERVVDACAGAGGKSLHMAALMGNKGKILALDVHQGKLDELKIRARRAGSDIIETRVIESQKVIKRLHESADRLLLDVPCSGSGVFRRNPDSKWKLTEERVNELLDLQATILNTYSSMVKIGGTLVYSTCSVLPSENENQVQKFLSQKETGWRLEEELHLGPDGEGSDGFYAARLVRI